MLAARLRDVDRRLPAEASNRSGEMTQRESHYVGIAAMHGINRDWAETVVLNSVPAGLIQRGITVNIGLRFFFTVLPHQDRGFAHVGEGSPVVSDNDYDRSDHMVLPSSKPRQHFSGFAAVGGLPQYLSFDDNDRVGSDDQRTGR